MKWEIVSRPFLIQRSPTAIEIDFKNITLLKPAELKLPTVKTNRYPCRATPASINFDQESLANPFVKSLRPTF